MCVKFGGMVVYYQAPAPPSLDYYPGMGGVPVPALDARACIPAAAGLHIMKQGHELAGDDVPPPLP